MKQSKVERRIGKYEVGKTIGQGSFAKVKLAKNCETGQSVALKILNKDMVLKHKMTEQVVESSNTQQSDFLILLDVLASLTTNLLCINLAD